jgi:hypothetical protein
LAKILSGESPASCLPLLLNRLLSYPDHRPYLLNGSVNLFGALAVVYAHRFSPFAWEGDSATIKSVSALWVFVFFLGVEELIRQLGDALVYGDKSFK